MKTQVKTTLVSFALAFLNSNLSFTQEFYIGSRFGIGESTLDLQDIQEEKSKLALSGGISTAYEFNRFLGITSDFLLVSKGGGLIGQENTSNIIGQARSYEYRDQYNIYSLEVPIALKASLPVSKNFTFKVFAGPSFQFQLLGTESRTFTDPDYNAENYYTNRKLNDLKTMECGMIYGGGFDVRARTGQTFFLDVKSNKSLSDMGFIHDKKVTSSYYMLSIGYLF